MEFRILGPLEVHEGERDVRLRGGKQRALLALLLVNADRTLALDRIVDELWGEDVPDSAQKMVQIYVSKLRKVLPAGMVHTRPPGYALHLEPHGLDLERFERLTAEARASLDGGRPDDAAAAYRTALDLWHGPALAEFTSEPFAQAEGARLEELRVNALEGRLEADLQLGRHADLVGRARRARRAPSAARGAAAPADARALPLRPAGGGARRIPGGEARARRRARDRALTDAARPRAADPPAGLRPRPGAGATDPAAAERALTGCG